MTREVEPTNNRKPGIQGRVLLWLLALAGFLLATASSAQAQDKKETDGLFVTVPTPITEKVINLIEHKVKDAAKKRKIKTVVFDFNPGGEKAGTSDPWMCMKLKDYIRKLELGGAEGVPNNLSTVAFVHGQVSKHTLLPVLACNQLVMSKESNLGPISTGQELLPGEIKNAYLKLARPKHATELVEQMLKGQKVTTAEALKIKLCNEIYETREQLAEALDLPKKSLKENWLAGRVPVVGVIPLHGTVNPDKLSSLERRINSAVLEGKNLIILELDCEGGDLSPAAQFQQFLKSRQDRDGLPLTIIAWVPPGRSLGAATFLALGCTEIVMGEDSYLGDFAYLADSDPKDLEFRAGILANVAREQHYPPLLFQATLDPNLVVYDVVSKATRQHSLLKKEDYEEEKHDWDLAGELKKNNGELVKIDAQLASDWDVAIHTSVNSLDELYGRYNLDNSQAKLYGDDWLDRVAEFFRQPVVKLFLLLIGITGLILEVKLPGFGLPGIVAAICFVLFFWSHSFVNQFTMLAVLLFVLGLMLLAIEVFVVPGFGIPGISGLLLLVVGLVLVTVEKQPVTTQDWQELGASLGIFCLSAVGAVFLAITIVSFLPQIPYANRLMLPPPEEEDDETTTATASLAALLGAIGIAETPLRPAGKARFGDEYLDVISEGDYITPGSRVQVIEIEGNRIVVKHV